MDIPVFIGAVVDTLIEAATVLLTNLGTIFTDVFALVYDTVGEALTPLGAILVATAGFALAWSGIRFILGFVQRLLNKSRAGR